MKRPLLIYDADCGFCRRWVLRWQAQTRGRVDFEPSQTAAARLPRIPAERFQDAVCLIEPERVSWGAEAVFRALSRAPGRGWLLALYQRIAPFAAVSEACYAFVARRRVLFSRLTRLLWGDDLRPPTYYGARWLFLKALALCYLAAFVSLAVQVDGLIGSRGLLPAADFLRGAHAQLGARAYALLPGVFWLSASDLALRAACWGGAGLSVLLLAGLCPGPLLLALWALYLSFLGVGQDFLGFQWDILLVEAGFLAVFLAPWTPRPGLGQDAPPEGAFVWLLRWLLFRLMLESGLVKLAGGDATWRSLTALFYHYQTQPLPTWIGWHAHQLPRWFQKGSCGLVFFIELAVPFLIWLPRRPRAFAFGAFVFLQALIALTGNYCFFNLLAAALALPLLDDALLRARLPAALARQLDFEPGEARPGWRTRAAAPIAAFAVLAGGLQLAGLLGLRPPLPAAAGAALSAAAPLRLVNGYGLFAMMTTTRDEIVLEGSDDGKTWREYEFRWKPGDVARRPRFVAPHQPRLDWQMWFAALGPYDQSPWFGSLVFRLLEGSPPVLGLLARNPFPDAPPRYVRALLYEYRFTTPQEKAATGAWWTRRLLGPYCPVARLREPGSRESQAR